MSRLRRPAVLGTALGVVLALALGLPGAAGADPAVTDAELTQSVRALATGEAVFDLALAESVLPLETEEDEGRQVTVRISSDVLFDFNKATLTDTARRRISQLAPRLRAASGAVQISGHSDSVGAPAYNLALSRQRAEAVKAELQRSLGGTAVRLQAQGFGETKPVVPNTSGGKDDPAARAKNRRVDITFQKS